MNNSVSMNIARAATRILSDQCAQLLAEGKALSYVAPVANSEGGEALFRVEFDEHISSWFPLFMGLSANVDSQWPEVCSAALSAFFKVRRTANT